MRTHWQHLPVEDDHREATFLQFFVLLYCFGFEWLPFSESHLSSNLVRWIEPDGMSASDIGASEQNFCFPFFLGELVHWCCVCGSWCQSLANNAFAESACIQVPVLVIYAWFQNSLPCCAIR